MNVIRSHARLTPGVRRFLLAAPIALAIITGLLSMHVLTGSHQPALASETSAMSTHSQVGSAPAAADDTPMTAAAAEGAGGHCQDGCGSPAGMPDHSLLMMVCVLALAISLTYHILQAPLRDHFIKPIRFPLTPDQPARRSAAPSRRCGAR